MDNLISRYGQKEPFKCDNILTNYSCKHCDFKTELKIFMSTHFHHDWQRSNFNVTDYVCNNCNFTSYSILMGYIHQKNCIKLLDTSFTLLSCKFCAYKSTAHKALREHCLIHHPDKMYKCNQCLFNATRKWDLMLHITVRHTKPEEIEWYGCTQCNYKGKLERYLKRHIREVHTDKGNRKMYECSQCSFKTISRASVYLHKKEHSDFKPYQCTQCSYQTYDTSCLRRHINSRHAKAEEIEWFYCDQCVFKTKRRSCIGAHIVAKHSNEGREKVYRYKCDMCFYKTNGLRELRDHRRAKHTDPSKIDHCYYKAKTKRALIMHVKRKHGGYRK